MNTPSELTTALKTQTPWIMGILNASPDSFSDGEVFNDREAAHAKMAELFDHGAHLVDLGAEASGPGSRPISAEVERSRLSPFFPLTQADRFVSVDTYKAATAQFALEHGARMINDISALRADKEMLSVVRDHRAFLVMMFAKGDNPLPHVNDEKILYKDVVGEISAFLLRRTELALRGGLLEQQIMLDPGFGKFISDDPAVSWELLERMEELCDKLKPFPVLIGVSRKGFLGGKLEERDSISLQVAAKAAAKGASCIRTHNVSLTSEFFRRAGAET